MRAEDILRVKRSHPELLLQRNVALIKAPQFQFWTFSTLPGPMRDARLRRAASMLLDRDAYIDAIENLAPFRDAGLPVEALWNSHQHAGQPNWIDPRNNASELGEGGKFFQFDPAEARKLVTAAGHQSVPLPISYRANNTARENEIIASMLGDGGIFQMETRIIDEPTHRNYQASFGAGFEGIWVQTNGGHNEEAWFVNMYTPSGKFTTSKDPIPGITDKVIRTRRELDDDRRNALLKEVQRDLAMDMTALMQPGYAIGFTLSWPWLKNYGTFVHGDLTPTWSSSRVYTEYWYDKSSQT